MITTEKRVSLLEIATLYRSLQGQYGQAKNNPQRRQELAVRIAAAGREGDEAAETLRGWLEMEENTQSKYRPSAEKIYNTWEAARRAFHTWKDAPTPERLVALRNAEATLSEAIREITKKIELF